MEERIIPCRVIHAEKDREYRNYNVVDIYRFRCIIWGEKLVEFTQDFWPLKETTYSSTEVYCLSAKKGFFKTTYRFLGKIPTSDTSKT